MWITFLELEGSGITEAAFRGGSPRRRTDFSWPVPDEHKAKLRDLLKAGGLDLSQTIYAQERTDADGFLLTQ